MKKRLCLVLAMAMTLSLGVYAQASDYNEEQNASFSDIVLPDPDKEYKERIVIGTESQNESLNPMLKGAIPQYMLFKCTHDRLIEYDPATGEFVPSLAVEWEQVDELTYRFKLRDDVSFHDGTTFDAYDVQATFDNNITSGIAGYYDHCNVVDDYTVEVCTKAPYVDWLFNLSTPSASICSAEAIAEDVESATTGTGRWIVKEWVQGDSIYLTRNDNYWGTLPATKELVFRFYAEASPRLIALENGEIDVCIAISATDVEYAKQNNNIVVDEYDSTEIVYSFVNSELDKWKDDNFKKAVAYGIDRDAILQAYNGIPAWTYFGWNQDGYIDEFEENYTYDPEKAKEFLSKTEYNSFTFTTTAAYQTLATIVQGMLGQIGITVDIEILDPAGQGSRCVYDGDFDFSLSTIGLADSSSDIFRVTGRNFAFCNLHDEDSPFYTLQEQSNAEFDHDKRMELLKEWQTFVHENNLYYPYFYKKAVYAYTKGAENTGKRANGHFDFSMLQIPLE